MVARELPFLLIFPLDKERSVFLEIDRNLIRYELGIVVRRASLRLQRRRCLWRLLIK